VVGLDVGRGAVVVERLDEHVLVRVLDAARPLEEDVAGLVAGGLGELRDDLGPRVGELRLDLVLDGDEVHRGSLDRWVVDCRPGPVAPQNRVITLQGQQFRAAHLTASDTPTTTPGTAARSPGRAVTRPARHPGTRVGARVGVAA
jgi:hypothetical protein